MVLPLNGLVHFLPDPSVTKFANLYIVLILQDSTISYFKFIKHLKVFT